MAAGIEFLLELEAKLDGAVGMVKALKHVETAASKADAALKKSEKGAGGVLRKVGGWFRDFNKDAAKGFSGMFAANAVWDTLKGGALGAVHLMRSLGEELLHAAAEAERTRISFENMLGVDVADNLLGNLDRVAKSTEFTDGSLKGFTQTLIDAGFAGDDLNRALAATIDTAARSPNKMAGAQAAITGLERIMLTGSFDARSLRSMKLSPKAVFEQMSKDLGMSVKQVEKQMGAGKLKQADVLNSVFKAIAAKGGGTLGSAGAAMANTMGARLEKIKDILPNLFEELEKGPGFAKVSGFMGKLVAAFDPGSETGKKIIGGLGSILDHFGTLLAGVDLDLWAGRLLTAMDYFKSALTIGQSIGSTVIGFFSELAKLGEMIGDFAFGTVQAYESLVQFGDDAIEWIGNLGPRLLEGALNAGRAVWQGLKEGISSGVTSVGEAITGLGDSAIGGLRGLLGIHSPSAEFEYLGEMSAAGYAKGLEVRPPALAVGGFMDGAAAGGGGGGAVTVNAPVTVHVAGSNASASEIAEAVRMEVSSSILGALEQLGLSRGAA